MIKVLYITYDGLLEPLGQSQVWSYLKRLSAEHCIYLISYEKRADLLNKTRVTQMHSICHLHGVNWFPQLYHKSPSVLATAYDIAFGSILGCYLSIRFHINIVHARSYVPAMMALMIKRITKNRFIFDMRGFWADERLDLGQWNKTSIIYRLLKKVERKCLLRADAVVSLTHASVNIMQQYDYMAEKKNCYTVIPTCADLSLFYPSQVGTVSSSFTLGYVGSVGGLYLFDEVLLAFRELVQQRPDSRLLVLNKGSHDYIHCAIKASGIDSSSIEVVACAYEDVPAYLHRMHASIFFIKPTFSKIASAATKLAEILGSGLPVLVNDGIGDQSDIILNDGQAVGVVVDNFLPDTLSQAIAGLLILSQDENMKKLCRTVAEQHFSVEWGAQQYAALYGAVL